MRSIVLRLAALLVSGAGGATAGEGGRGIAQTETILPTALDAARVALPTAKPLDGQSLLPLLTGKTSRPIATFYWSEGGAAGGFAVRSGDWKLVQQRSQTTIELFNLAKDPAETIDLAPQNTAKVAELTKLYDTWLDQMAEPMDGVGKRPTKCAESTRKDRKKKKAGK